MQFTLIHFASLALHASVTAAFPSEASKVEVQKAAHTEQLASLQARAEEILARRQLLPLVDPPFNAEQQLVSTSNKHKFVAPSGNDQRGPCPGLNAMANHGYLPRNGIVNFNDIVTGSAAVYGMGVDLSAFLAIYSAVFNGDLTKFSIGGPTGSILGLGGLLGEPQGLSGSHNKFETDCSATRGDLYQHGNGFLLQMPQFKALYEAGQANGNNLDIPTLIQRRYERFHESVSENPYFFNAPFAGVVAAGAAWSFIYRLMGNKTAEHPAGVLDGETLKSFFAISGDYPDFTYTAGHERIPENWYKRNTLDPYGFVAVGVDALENALRHQEFLSVGGNTGKTNSFVGVDVADLTKNSYNAHSLLEGNNLLCFGLQASLQQTPDFLSGLYSDVQGAMDLIGPAFSKATSALGCPQLNGIAKGQFDKYPGFAKLKKNGSF